MGRLPLPKTVSQVVHGMTVFLVVWVVWGALNEPEAMWAPGDLSAAHTSIKSCTRCHVPFHGPNAAKCIGCHSEEWFGRETMPEIAQRHHAAIREKQACSKCHFEHRGYLYAREAKGRL